MANEIVRTARTLSGLSRSQLAALAGVSPSTVTRIEAGKLDPTMGMVERVLCAAGYRFDARLLPVSDPIAVAAARSVLDPASGLGSFPGVGAWLDRWVTAKLVTRDPATGAFEARSAAELARRAGLSARLAFRPGLRSYQRETSWSDTASLLRSSGRRWASTGGAAANRLAPSADAPWQVFYVDEPDLVAAQLGLVPQADRSWPIVLIPFDGVAEVGIEVGNDGLCWAAPLQVLIDCYGGSDRMPEQAEALVEVLLVDA